MSKPRIMGLRVETRIGKEVIRLSKPLAVFDIEFKPRDANSADVLARLEDGRKVRFIHENGVTAMVA